MVMGRADSPQPREFLMNVVAFPDRVGDLPAVWRRDVFTKRIWQIEANRAIQEGEAGGFVVQSPGFEHLAYLKPTNICTPDRPKAAYEKIAADLAFDVGVSVPPVLLYRRKHAPEDEESRACVSVIIYDEQWEWGQFWEPSPPGIADILRTVLARSSGAIALDTWFGNTDRRNKRNAIFGTFHDAPAQGAFMFLDFSNSLNMGNRWAQNGFQEIEVPPLPDILLEAVDWNVLDQTTSRIEDLDEDSIDAVVGRIPLDYMEQKHSDIVASALKERRRLIRARLEQSFKQITAILDGGDDA